MSDRDRGPNAPGATAASTTAPGPAAAAPVAPSPAATLILVRERGGAPEILLLKRSAQARFMPNAYVFPGGAVDSADAARAPRRPVDCPGAVVYLFEYCSHIG